MRIEDEVKTTKFISNRQKAVVSILFTASWLENKTNTALKKHGLSSQQYNILRILKGKHPKSMSLNDIRSRMIDRMSNVSRLIEKMKIKGIVEREESENDRRMVEITLTDKGLKLLEDASKDFPDDGNFPSTITDEEAKILVQVLDKMRS